MSADPFTQELLVFLRNSKRLREAKLTQKRCNSFEPHHERNRLLPIRKQRRRSAMQVPAQLTSAFVFASRIVKFLYFLSPKCPASSHLLRCTTRFVSDLFGKHIVDAAHMVTAFCRDIKHLKTRLSRQFSVKVPTPDAVHNDSLHYHMTLCMRKPAT